MKKEIEIRKKLLSDKVVVFLMALIPFLSLFVFAYGPIFGWGFAFFRYKVGMPFDQMTFVGLKYFKWALEDSELLKVVINTLVMSSLGLLIIPISALFAIALSELRLKSFSKIIQTVTTIPYFMSWVIVFSVFSIFLSRGDGILNNLLLDLGIINTPLNPLGNVEITWFFQTGVKYWKELGYNSIIFFAALASIDTELYEAAAIDGANRLQVIRYITLPGLIPTLVVLLLINIGFLLSVGFEQHYVFYNGLVAPKIMTIDLYSYKVGLLGNDISLATAISVSKSFVSVFLVFTVNYIVKKLRGQSIL